MASYFVGQLPKVGRDADSSQIDNLETLIGSRAVCRSRALGRAKYVSFSSNYGEVRNYGFGLPGRSVSPQVDSDKLRNKLHSEEQMP